MELSSSTLHRPEALLSHANAALTARARLRLARLVVEDGWTYAAVAKLFMVSPRTAKNVDGARKLDGFGGRRVDGLSLGILVRP